MWFSLPVTNPCSPSLPSNSKTSVSTPEPEPCSKDTPTRPRQVSLAPKPVLERATSTCSRLRARRPPLSPKVVCLPEDLRAAGLTCGHSTHPIFAFLLQASPRKPKDMYPCLNPTPASQSTYLTDLLRPRLAGRLYLCWTLVPQFNPNSSGLLKTLHLVDVLCLPASDPGSSDHICQASSTDLCLTLGSGTIPGRAVQLTLHACGSLRCSCWAGSTELHRTLAPYTAASRTVLPTCATLTPQTISSGPVLPTLHDPGSGDHAWRARSVYLTCPSPYTAASKPALPTLYVCPGLLLLYPVGQLCLPLLDPSSSGFT